MMWPHSYDLPLVIANVEPFYIAKYPITNAQYAVYLNETGHEPPI